MSINLKIQGEISEEEIEQKLEILTRLRDQQKELFITIIKRFIEVITNQLNMPDIKTEDGEKPVSAKNPHWIKWVGERFEDFLIKVTLMILHQKIESWKTK